MHFIMYIKLFVWISVLRAFQRNRHRSRDGTGGFGDRISRCQFSDFNEASSFARLHSLSRVHLHASARTKRRRANGAPWSSLARQFVRVKTWRDSVMNTKLKAKRPAVLLFYSTARLAPRETEDATWRPRRGNWKKEIFTSKLACLRKGFHPAVDVLCEDNTSRTH